MKKIAVVGFSGGVTSAWCAGWAIREYGAENVILLFQDTKEEDRDTYRFLNEMATALGLPITEYSDGRSVTELFYDMNMLANDVSPFCSRVLKVEPGIKFMRELSKGNPHAEITKIVGFSENEPDRVQRATSLGWTNGYNTRYPMIEMGTTKQQCADWCSCTMGIVPPSMYEWSTHANCVGCARGGKEYWLAVKQNRLEVFEQRRALEIEFGHTFSSRYSLTQIESEGLKRKVTRKEAILVGPCDCGD